MTNGLGFTKWIEYIKWRIRKNKNFLGVFIGPTGSGKSYGALALAEHLSNGNLPRENICFTGKEFLTRLRTGLENKTLKGGDVLVWDEAGVDLNAKQWQAATHRAVNIVMQIFRKENIIVLFTVPFLSFIDSDTRKLIHTCFRTRRIDFTTKELICSPINLQPNQMSGKIYTHSLKALKETGELRRKVKIRQLRIPLASEPIIKYYEEIKDKFVYNQYAKSESVFSQFEQNEGVKSKLLFFTQREVLAKKLYDEYHGDIEKIAETMEVGTRRVYGYLANWRKKDENRKGIVGFEQLNSQLATPQLNLIDTKGNAPANSQLPQ